MYNQSVRQADLARSIFLKQHPSDVAESPQSRVRRRQRLIPGFDFDLHQWSAFLRSVGLLATVAYTKFARPRCMPRPGTLEKPPHPGRLERHAARQILLTRQNPGRPGKWFDWENGKISWLQTSERRFDQKVQISWSSHSSNRLAGLGTCRTWGLPSCSRRDRNRDIAVGSWRLLGKRSKLTVRKKAFVKFQRSKK